MAVTANYAAAYDLSLNARFQQRLQIAMLDQVAAVAVEAGATTNHANRLIFSAMVAYNPASWAAKMALGCIVGNAAIQAACNPVNPPQTNQAAIADSALSAAVATVWNFYADTAVAIQAALKGAI